MKHDNNNDNNYTNTDIDTSYGIDVKTIFLAFNLLLFYIRIGNKSFILCISTMTFQVILNKLIFKTAYKQKFQLCSTKHFQDVLQLCCTIRLQTKRQPLYS